MEKTEEGALERPSTFGNEKTSPIRLNKPSELKVSSSSLNDSSAGNLSRKYISITNFDNETNELLDFIFYPDEPQRGDIYLRAFRMRKEFPNAQVDVVESPDGSEPSPLSAPISKDEYLQHRIRDWIIVALSKLNSGKQVSNNIFRSIDNLPLTYEQLVPVLEFVTTHPFYRGQQMFFKSSDEIDIVVHGGSIIKQDSGSHLYLPDSSPKRALTPESRREQRRIRQSVKAGVKTRRRCNTCPPQNLFTFSVAITTLHHRHQLHVLELPNPPKTLEEFFIKAGKLILDHDRKSASASVSSSNSCSDSDSLSEDENEVLHFTRAFTLSGRELNDIKTLLNYCTPTMSNISQNWGVATVVLSMGEEFF